MTLEQTPRSRASGRSSSGPGAAPRMVRGSLARAGIVAWCWAAPGAFSAGSQGAPFATTWCLLAGSVALPLAGVILSGRALRGEWHRLALPMATLLVVAIPWALAAGWLWSHTHHRPLGAVTFTAAALTILVATWFFVGRVATLKRAVERKLGSHPRLALAVVVAPAWIGAFMIALAGGDELVGYARWDAALGVALTTCALLGRGGAPVRRGLELAFTASWGLAIAAGLMLALASESHCRTLEHAAPSASFTLCAWE